MYNPQLVNNLCKLQAQASICADQMIASEHHRLLAERFEKDAAVEKDEGKRQLLTGKAEAYRSDEKSSHLTVQVYMTRVERLAAEIFAQKGKANGS